MRTVLCLTSDVVQLPEHLKAFYKTWSEYRNEENSIEQHRTAYEALIKVLAVNAKSMPKIPTQPRAALASGLDPASRVALPEPVTAYEVGNLLDLHSVDVTSRFFNYIGPPEPGSSRGQKRTLPSVGADDSSSTRKTTHQSAGPQSGNSRKKAVDGRKHRSCVQCRRPECQGKFMSRPCEFPNERRQPASVRLQSHFRVEKVCNQVI